MIITIDGPAGAGKSSVAKELAKQLTATQSCEFEYLDTGSMYRAVALLGLRAQVDWDQPSELEQLARSANIDVQNARTLLNDEDITDEVRSPQVTSYTRFAADNPVIREIMVQLQRQIAQRMTDQNRSVITEGRDQGTVVFPDADYKIYLTATPEERAHRRIGEWAQRGDKPNFETILQEINQRDARDQARPVGPLRKPDDAVEVVTDQMNLYEVVEHLINIVTNS